jgi:integrase
VANLRKRGQKWQVRIRINKRSISRIFDKKSDASKWGSETETAIRQGLYVDNSRLNTIRLRELVWLFYEKTKRGAKHPKRFKSEVENLLSFPICNLFLTELTVQVLAEFRDEHIALGKSASTVKKYLGLISRAINKGRREMSVPLAYNPVSIIEKPKEGKGRDRVLSEIEYEHLLNVASQSKQYWVADIIIFAQETLMRQGEILAMKRCNVSRDKSTLYIPDSKNGEARSIGLSYEAMQVIEKQPVGIDGKVFQIRTRQQLDYWFRKAVDEACIMDFRFHDLRHCGTSRLAENGWNTQELQAQGGWKDVRMLARYTHINSEHLAQKLRGKI